jgi:hypothetical protein
VVAALLLEYLVQRRDPNPTRQMDHQGDTMFRHTGLEAILPGANQSLTHLRNQIPKFLLPVGLVLVAV